MHNFLHRILDDQLLERRYLNSYNLRMPNSVFFNEILDIFARRCEGNSGGALKRGLIDSLVASNI
jgi:hypothetical protein